jgi:pyruvate/2-oxoglutarate dehydrogenase complex dihydrolipoamide dehydrogenase (E3) component
MEEFDLVVLGTGSAASTVASRTRAAGWRVAVVDSRPWECSNRKRKRAASGSARERRT